MTARHAAVASSRRLSVSCVRRSTNKEAKTDGRGRGRRRRVTRMRNTRPGGDVITPLYCPPFGAHRKLPLFSRRSRVFSPRSTLFLLAAKQRGIKGARKWGNNKVPRQGNEVSARFRKKNTSLARKSQPIFKFPAKMATLHRQNHNGGLNNENSQQSLSNARVNLKTGSF